MLNLKQKIIGIIAVVGTILILIFQHGFSSSKPAALLEKQNQIQTVNPEIISTSPSPLDQAIIWGQQPIEITFNLPLENIPELKYKFEPQSELKVELLNDKKTVRFTPVKPLPLGVSYTLSLPASAKFDGQKTLGKDYIFSIRTIEYKGV